MTARRDPQWERIRSWRRNAGAVPGPFEAWLLQRGMRTLYLRARHASDSALSLARHFEGHRALAAVLYPGLPSHLGHEIAARQMIGGFGGMLSIRVHGGEERVKAIVAAVRVFKRATSLGGVESLIEHRASSEGPSSPVPNDLLRLSIGLEAPQDLVADLEAALDAAVGVGIIRAPAALASDQSTSPVGPSLVDRVAAALQRGVAPLIIARGGAVRVVAVDDGVVTLEASGSPGANFPARARIEELLRAAVPEVTGLRVVAPGGILPLSSPPVHLLERIQRVLDEEVVPAIATHRGRVTLVGVDDGWISIRLEGGCQGCSMAAVTVRQGIEPILRARIPEMIGLVDITDHEAGAEPFFSPSKR